MNFTWSYSRLGDYEKCARLYKYRHIDRLPEPKGEALSRGIAIHEEVEQYLFGKAPLPSKFDAFKAYIEEVKNKPGLIVEELWGLTREWVACAPKSPLVWWRGKLDAYWRDGVTSASVVDWKTGRVYDSNTDQMKMYAAAVMSREPEVEEVAVSLVYFDQKEEHTEVYYRDRLDYVRGQFTSRAGRMEEDKTFDPKPGPACRWCAFRKSKGGPCSEG
jgi:CRISPR/Cas system-associated exonuclease Cas4 (RecB family)